MTLTRPQNTPDKLECLAGEPIVLEIQVSRSSAEVVWRLNGREVEESSNVTITEDGLINRLTIHCPNPDDSGKYTCDAVDDKIDFEVKVSGNDATSALEIISVLKCNSKDDHNVVMMVNI